MNKDFIKKLLCKIAFEKKSSLYDDIKKSLEEKGFKDNLPVYSGEIKIPAVKAGVSVIVPDNPIINGKYNVFFQIRAGNNPTKAGINTIIVNAEAGGIASKENTEAFGNSKWINDQLAIIQDVLSKKFGNVSLNRLGLGAFSGGFSAISKILSDPAMKSRIDSVVILDGIHGGSDPNKMKPWLDYAEIAKNDPKKKFVFLHSAIDPGSYSSTTDSANYLIEKTKAQKAQTDKTYAGIKPVSVSNIGGFTTIELYGKKSDKPGYGYEAHSDNRPGSAGHQHIMAAKALPDVWQNYLNDWNDI
jgi:hypothetical protein